RLSAAARLRRAVLHLPGILRRRGGDVRGTPVGDGRQGRGRRAELLTRRRHPVSFPNWRVRSHACTVRIDAAHRSGKVDQTVNGLSGRRPMDKYSLVVNGKAVPAAGHFEVLNPSTGAVVGLAPKASSEQLDDAVESARKA